MFRIELIRKSEATRKSSLRILWESTKLTTCLNLFELWTQGLFKSIILLAFQFKLLLISNINRKWSFRVRNKQKWFQQISINKSHIKGNFLCLMMIQNSIIYLIGFPMQFWFFRPQMIFRWFLLSRQIKLQNSLIKIAQKGLKIKILYDNHLRNVLFKSLKIVGKSIFEILDICWRSKNMNLRSRHKIGKYFPPI